MRTRRFRLEPNGFAIARNSIPRLSLRHQQISEELVGIRKFGVGAQPSLQLALRVVVPVGPAEQHCKVVPGGGITGPEPQGDFEMLLCLTRVTCSRKKI